MNREQARERRCPTYGVVVFIDIALRWSAGVGHIAIL